MRRVVIDTNVLVSALWKKSGSSSQIIDLVVLGQLIPFYFVVTPSAFLEMYSHENKYERR